MYSRAIPLPGDDSDEKENQPLYDDSKDACKDIDLDSNDDEEIIVKK